jgi:RNA polymerase sigma-70 factor (ECF subfamily)
MGGHVAPPDQDSFACDLQRALLHCRTNLPRARSRRCHNFRLPSRSRGLRAPQKPASQPRHLATERELSDFLQSVERRAFKRTVYHVRDDEAALDIVQDSMMKLAEHYGGKPTNELPMLFQRILSNCTLDWFRRQKTRNALFSNLSDFESASDDGDFDLLETYAASDSSQQVESAEDATRRAQILREIETEIMELPARQREAFLMRYWEDMDVAETAAAMGCSEGSVKTHCSRAVAALSKALKAKGIQL